MSVRHTPPIATHPESPLKLGRRMQSAVLIGITVLGAVPLILTGVAEGAEGWTRTPIAIAEGHAAEQFPTSGLGAADVGDGPQLPGAAEAGPTPPPAVSEPQPPAEGPAGVVTPAPADPVVPPAVDVPLPPLDPPPADPAEPAPGGPDGP